MGRIGLLSLAEPVVRVYGKDKARAKRIGRPKQAARIHRLAYSFNPNSEITPHVVHPI